MEQKKKAFLDVSVSVRPYCGALYADANWYVIGLASDVECGVYRSLKLRMQKN